MTATTALRGSAAFAGVLVCVVLAGCAGGSSQADGSGAAFSPRLRVEQRPSLPGRPTTVVIDVSQQTGELALASADIVVPDGFSLEPPASGPLGELEAALGSGETVLAGPLAPAERTRVECGGFAGTAFSAALTGPGGAAVSLPVLLRRDGDARLLTICAPSAEELPGRQAIRRLTLRLGGGVTAPAIGDALWRAVFVPEGGRRAEATESRAIVPAPSFLTLEAVDRADGRIGSTIRLRGYLLQREAQPGRVIKILAGATPDELEAVGRVRTRRNGSFEFDLPAPERVGLLYVAARASSVERPCRAGADGPCTATTVSGVSSNPLQLTISG